MSTDLYGIRILKKEPDQKKITMKVIVVYYDVAYESHEPLPTDKSMFLRVLWDRDAYIATKISMDEFLDEDWVNANAYKYIDQIKQLNTRNHPLKDYTGYHDFYYGDGPWKDEEKLVQADYEVYVHDARLFEHLEVGQSWGTTSYQTVSYVHPGVAAPFMPNFDSQVARLEPFPGIEQGTEVLVFTKDASKLIASSSENEIVCYDTATWQELWRQKFEDMFGDMKIDDEQGIVWITRYNKIAGVVDIATGALSDKIPKTAARGFSRTGKYAVEYGEDDLLDFGDGRSIEQPGCVEAFSFSADDKLVAMGGGSYHFVDIWNTETLERVHTINTALRTSRLAFSPDAKYITVVSFDKLTVYEVATGKLLMNNIKTDSTSFGMPVWSPDGKYFAINHYNYFGYDGYTGIYKIGM
ncbi:WD40 repeat domain-containing protein [Flavobacterium sp.]|uniref:WD40 repeat domain-containing protein n=1 Tax=Flavobacterium sp. TaxID=239 RepID=UPI004033EC63